MMISRNPAQDSSAPTSIRVRNGRGWCAATAIARGPLDSSWLKDTLYGYPIRIEGSGRVIATDGFQLLIINNCVEGSATAKPLYLMPLKAPCVKGCERLPQRIEFGEGEAPNGEHWGAKLVRSDGAKPERYTITDSNFPDYWVAISTKQHYVPTDDFVPLDAHRVAPIISILTDPENPGPSYGWRYVNENLLQWQHPGWCAYFVATLRRAS